MTIEFLTVADALELHRAQLERYGGADGLRDRGLLESAVAQAGATFGGDFLHHGILEMAAAYVFHIVSNHPFVDGNKRTGLLAALVFVDLNGIRIQEGSEQLYELTMAVARGDSDVRAIAAVLESLAESG